MSSSTTTANYSSAIHDMLEAYDMEFEEIGTSVSDCIQQLKKVSLNNDNSSSSSSNNDTFETLQRKIKRQFDSLDGTIQNMETQLSTIRLNSNNNNSSSSNNNNDMLKYWKQRINDQHKRRLQSLKTEYQNTLQSILMQDHHHHHHHTHYDDSEHDYNNNNNNNNRYRYNSDDSDDSDDDDDLLDYHTSNNNKKQKASKETKRLIKNSSETLHHTIQVANHIEQTGMNIMGTLVDQRGILERIRGNIDLTNDELHQGGRVLSRMEWRNWIQKSCLILIIVALVVFCLLYLFFKIRSLFQ